MTTTDILSLTGSEQTFRWNTAATLGTPIVVTYSFPTSQPSYDSGSRPGFQGFSVEHQSHIRTALDTWAASSGIAFVEVPESVGGNIQFAMQDMSGLVNSVGRQLSGYGFFPNWQSDGSGNRSIKELDIGGDIFMNAAYYAHDAAAIAPGIRGYSILLHEIGHALGFKHPFEGTPTIDPSKDSGEFTIMSYNRPHSTVSLGSIDVQASQFFYGNSDLNFTYDGSKVRLDITGTASSEHIIGTNINDVVRASAGNDRVDFGLGTDTLVVASTFAAAMINRTSTGFTVSSVTDGLDTVTGLERIQFTDGLLALDVDGIAGQAFRIYKAAFARTPDSGGLKNWIDHMDLGMDLMTVAGHFVDSAEFKSTYGVSPSSKDIVSKFYNNVLGRDGETAGQNHWEGQLDSGSQSVAQVLAGFSESFENISGVAPTIADGIFFS